jgi:uncharacterized protein (TIGR02147 family)
MGSLLMTEINIFKYDDYRFFLKDYYEEQKVKFPEKFSYRYFSRKAGFATPNFLYLVINAKRNLTLDSATKVSKAISLRGQKHKYFETLVFFNQAKKNREKTKYFEKLISFKGYQSTRIVENVQKLYLSKWYYPVVREMVNMPAFRPNPQWVATHITPQITAEEAEDALKMLIKLKMVKAKTQKKWALCDPVLSTDLEDVSREVVGLHQKMISLGSESLGQSAAVRDVSGVTMSVCPAKFKIIRKRIQEFHKDIQALIQMPVGEAELINENIYTERDKKKSLKVSKVCQLNIQFFQLAHNGEKND